MEFSTFFPAIDPVATGHNLETLMKSQAITPAILSEYLHLTTARAVYKWLNGETMPTLDNLYAIGVLLKVPIDRIVIGNKDQYAMEPQSETCGPAFAA